MTLINQALANKVQRIGMQLISVFLSSALAPFYRNQNWTNQKKNRTKIHENKIESNQPNGANVLPHPVFANAFYVIACILRQH